MLNNVCLMGRLVADPELRTTNSGVSVCSFRIAVDRNHQPKGADREADFINITAWRSTADFISKYFKKGSMIVVQGSIQTDTFTDKEGNKRTNFFVQADQAMFGGGKNDASKEATAPAANTATVNTEYIDVEGEDLPF